MKFATIEELKQYQNDHGVILSTYEYKFNANDEWEEMEIINPENDQKKINALVLADEVNYEKARMELTLTTQYHDWRNTIADKIMEQIDNADGRYSTVNLDADNVRKYNKQVEASNQYADNLIIFKKMDVKRIAKIVNANSR